MVAELCCIATRSLAEPCCKELKRDASRIRTLRVRRREMGKCLAMDHFRLRAHEIQPPFGGVEGDNRISAGPAVALQWPHEEAPRCRQVANSAGQNPAASAMLARQKYNSLATNVKEISSMDHLPVTLRLDQLKFSKQKREPYRPSGMVVRSIEMPSSVISPNSLRPRL